MARTQKKHRTTQKHVERKDATHIQKKPYFCEFWIFSFFCSTCTNNLRAQCSKSKTMRGHYKVRDQKYCHDVRTYVLAKEIKIVVKV